MGFWIWWFKETLFWWTLFIGLSLEVVFIILGLTVNQWFLIVPCGTLGIMCLLFVIVAYIVPTCKNIKNYFSERKREYNKTM